MLLHKVQIIIPKPIIEYAVMMIVDFLTALLGITLVFRNVKRTFNIASFKIGNLIKGDFVLADTITMPTLYSSEVY